MYKTIEKILLILSDFLSGVLAFLCWAWLRKELGFFSESNFSVLIYLSIIISAYWFIMFLFFGLYNSWYAKSRVDEIILLFKTISFGVFLIFLITFDIEKDLSSPPQISRLFIINYWLLLLFFVTITRLIFRTFQRFLLSSGIGTRRTLIVGWNKKSWELLDDLVKYPALGYDVIGFIGPKNSSLPNNSSYKNLPLLGNYSKFRKTIESEKAQEVIFCLESDSRKKVLDMMNACNGVQVNFKIIPDLYEIVIGQVRTNQLYGFPLLDVLPHFMKEWEKKSKRIVDILASMIILAVFLPAWIAIAAAIKLDSTGPVLYTQKRIGKDEKEFTLYKFRSMVSNAEKETGPQWAKPNDPRITKVGRFIRKYRLDEIPQFINVIKGDMSLVGPRPERPYFVDKFKKNIPFYSRRLQIKPGITGWAQIKGEYDTSIENVKTKLQYDLFYLENMSLKMDLKILLNTIYVMMIGKGL